MQGEGMWLGLATEHRFGPGYKLAGLLFGGPGNLSDGGALVTGKIDRRNKRPALNFTGKWGPKLRDRDRLGMKLEVKAGRALVSFSRNGTGLGTAFDIQVQHSSVSHLLLLCLTTPAAGLERADPAPRSLSRRGGAGGGAEDSPHPGHHPATGRGRAGRDVAGRAGLAAQRPAGGAQSGLQLTNSNISPPRVNIRHG